MNRRGRHRVHRRLAPALLAPVMLIAAMFTAACAGDETTRPSVVVVTDAWSPPSGQGNQGNQSDPGNRRAFVYMTLTADGDDRLIGASVPPTVAQAATVQAGAVAGVGVGGHLGHLDGDGAPAHSHDDNSPIALTAQPPVVLAPGRGRIVLDGLTEALVAGNTFDITVRLASGTSVTVAVSVRTGE